MNAMTGWALVVLALAAGWYSYGWQGVVLAVSVVVFWLLLQFSRALRVMRNAAQAPVGRVPSVVMLQSKLKPGLTMMQVVGLTRSLGRKVDELPGGTADTWRWEDAGGVQLTLFFAAGKLSRWALQRPDDGAPELAEAPPAAP